jgi:hypothetical protein
MVGFLKPCPSTGSVFARLRIEKYARLNFRKLSVKKIIFFRLHGLAPPYETPIFEVALKCGTRFATAIAVD